MKKIYILSILLLLIVVPLAVIATSRYHEVILTVEYPNGTVKQERLGINIIENYSLSSADIQIKLDKANYEVVVDNEAFIEVKQVEPQLICRTGYIEGVLLPQEADGYYIGGTTSICADISWIPSDKYIWLGLLDEDTNLLVLRRFSGGSTTWCPSTEGYEYFVIANLYYDTALGYYGELTKCYS